MSALTQVQIVGGWMPKDHAVVRAWLAKKLAQVREERRGPQQWKFVIKQFLQMIEDDPVINMLFIEMFEQVPKKPPYDKDPTGKKQVQDYMEMLGLFDLILETPPNYEGGDLVGFPINAVLDWPMGTPAGLSAFVLDKVNAQFRAMLDVWAGFLRTKESAGKLTADPDGWFGQRAAHDMPDFKKNFKYNPDAEHFGYVSWDDFFTRVFINPELRPVVEKDNKSVINNAAESSFVYLVRDVKKFAKFWIKEQPYSLHHILDGDQSVSEFVGGTIYQAFLGARDYHRWHSPVDGEVTKCVNIRGTYFAESAAFGFSNPEGPDPAGPDQSQGFLTAVATRALVFIKADNPKIGLMCFIAIGMCDVSSCDITVREGDRVNKGDQLGMFHSGGSSHCLIFRRGVKLEFIPPVEKKEKVKVLLNAKLATVL